MKIVSFGDHLGASKNIGFAVLKAAQDGGVGVLPLNRVTIQPGDLCFRKEFLQHRLDLLRAFALKVADVHLSSFGHSFGTRCSYEQ